MKHISFLYVTPTRLIDIPYIGASGNSNAEKATNDIFPNVQNNSVILSLIVFNTILSPIVRPLVSDNRLQSLIHSAYTIFNFPSEMPSAQYYYLIS